MKETFHDNSIFFIETDKIAPNPFQPRRSFDEDKLHELAESIRQYGVLQPIVVVRREVEKDDGGIAATYEIIAGERRLRASKIAGLKQIPSVIRSADDTDRMKLEMAIIENIQREDLNPVDRALAFQKLAEDFGFKHTEIAKKIGKSREYVSNCVRLLVLPQEVLDALIAGKITEGHTRPLLMLSDREEQQKTLFKEMLYKKMTVREAEKISRRIAYDKVRKKDRAYTPEVVEIEEKLSELFGTRVSIDMKEVGGKVTIDFFSGDDLKGILEKMQNQIVADAATSEIEIREQPATTTNTDEPEPPVEESNTEERKETTQKEEKSEDADEDLYTIKNFSV